MESNTGSTSSLPKQRVTDSQRTENWKKSSMDYYINFRYTNGSNLRSDRSKKIINYDLANGIINTGDIMKICDPMGTGTLSFDDQFMHHDMISPILHELLGEEAIKPDNTLVYSESATDMSRKTEGLKTKIVELLKQQLMGEIDPSTIDPNNPPPTPEQVIKAERYSPSDLIESKANKMLKVLKKKLNTKLLLNQGFKDALIAGEEIYWTGISNGEPNARRVNPLNVTVILDDSDTFIDDALAVIEERLLTIPSILDEFGDELSKSDLDKLDEYSRGTFGTFNTAGGFEPVFTTTQDGTALRGVTPSTSYMGNNVNNYAVRVTRVEWMSMKQVGTLDYTDENGEVVSKLIDESFKPLFKDFQEIYPDAEVEWFWINEAWEGVKIGTDIYIGVRAKPNQRRRMDNPYYCKLGYTGFIYEATNSRSVSLVDRLKSYQYLRDIIAFKLQLVFSSDIGKVMLMDLAQIPRSEGIDLEKWMYYLKEMKIAFINSFEEGKKGVSQGKTSNFNQFNSIDMSFTQSVQQYINYLQFIDQQIYSVSGVNQQRLGKIHQDEAVTNVQQAQVQSETITQYLFEAHNEVKRRLYTSIIEVAKIAWRNGYVTQYVNDDLGIEMLNIEELEFENSDFAVFVSNLAKDKEIKQKLDQLAQVAMEQQKADLSTIIDTVVNDSPKDIINTLKRVEAEFYQRQAEQQKAEQQAEAQRNEVQKQLHAEQMADKQADRDLKQYEIDSNNATKIQVAEINTYIGQESLDQDNDGIPDPVELGKLSLQERDLASKMFTEQQKIFNDKEKHGKVIQMEQRKLDATKEIENKKLEAIKVQNANQIQLADKKAKLDKEMMDKKMEIEKMKAKVAIAKSKQKPKK
jgi:hypothetical protein